MSDPSRERTLVDIGRLFLDDDFFAYITGAAVDSSVIDFVKELKATTADQRGTILPYFQSKLTPFIANVRVRNVLGQSRSTVDFREAMDKGKIVLVNLAKGKLGELTSRLLGMILVSKATWAALSRAYIARAERRPFYLYVDEFQNFTTDAFLTVLSEARKYGLCLTLAHQFLAQLRISDNYTQAGRDALEAAVFGNVANVIAFQVASGDADRIAREIAGSSEGRDTIATVLAAQPKFHAVAKFDCGGETSSPFSIQTQETIVEADEDRGARLRQFVSERSLLPRSFVEEELVSSRDDFREPFIPWSRAKRDGMKTDDEHGTSAGGEGDQGGGSGESRSPNSGSTVRPVSSGSETRSPGTVQRGQGLGSAEPEPLGAVNPGLRKTDWLDALAERVGLPKSVVAALRSQYGDARALMVASDDQLRSIPDLGLTRIRAIRSALANES
jgi:hypothetical protein